MKLTKKYRLIWNDKKEIVNDPSADYTGTTTEVGEGLTAFESDNVEDIVNKINQLKLIRVDNNL